VADVPVVHHAEDVAGDPVPPEEIESPHHQVVGGLPSLGHPVRVVEVGGAVQAEAHGEAFVSQEAAPFLVQEGAVGHQGIEDAAARWGVLPLEGRDGAEVVHPQEGGLAPVPGEPDLPFSRRLHVLADVGLQECLAHPGRTRWRVEGLLVQVVAVAAVQVAEGAPGLGKNLEAGAH